MDVKLIKPNKLDKILIKAVVIDSPIFGVRSDAYW